MESGIKIRILAALIVTVNITKCLCSIYWLIIGGNYMDMTLAEILNHVVNLGVTPVLLLIFCYHTISKSKADDERVKEAWKESQEKITETVRQSQEREEMLRIEAEKREEMLRAEAEKRENMLRAEAEKRESILLCNMERLADSMDGIAKSMNKIESRLDKMEIKLERGDNRR